MCRGIAGGEMDATTGLIDFAPILWGTVNTILGVGVVAAVFAAVIGMAVGSLKLFNRFFREWLSHRLFQG